MGDVLTLYRKGSIGFQRARSLEMQKKMRTNTFTLEDYLAQNGEDEAVWAICRK